MAEVTHPVIKAVFPFMLMDILSEYAGVRQYHLDSVVGEKASGRASKVHAVEGNLAEAGLM